MRRIGSPPPDGHVAPQALIVQSASGALFLYRRV